VAAPRQKRLGRAVQGHTMAWCDGRVGGEARATYALELGVSIISRSQLHCSLSAMCMYS